MAQSRSTPVLEKGAATRRIKHKRRRAHRTLSILSKLSGQNLATWATRASRWLGNPDMVFEYDASDQLYICRQARAHAFAHPRRLWTLFDGLALRGKRLGLQYMLDQIDFADGDRIVDVGANTGDLSLMFEVIGCKVHIDAFEPSPGEFTALKRNLAANPAVTSHSAHQVALWNHSDAGLTFYLKAAKGDSSVLPIKGATSEIKVQSRRLDEVLPRQRYKLLKLEAEGAEPEILEGAEGIIDCFEYVTADVGFERGLTAESTLPQVTNFLLKHGFEIVGLNGSRMVLLFRNTKAVLE